MRCRLTAADRVAMRGRKEFKEFEEFEEFEEFSAAERRIHPSFQAKTALPTDECEVPSAASLNFSNSLDSLNSLFCFSLPGAASLSRPLQDPPTAMLLRPDPNRFDLLSKELSPD
jgi:hypothetical protein